VAILNIIEVLNEDNDDYSAIYCNGKIATQGENINTENIIEAIQSLYSEVDFKRMYLTEETSEQYVGKTLPDNIAELVLVSCNSDLSHIADLF